MEEITELRRERGGLNGSRNRARPAWKTRRHGHPLLPTRRAAPGRSQQRLPCDSAKFPTAGRDDADTGEWGAWAPPGTAPGENGRCHSPSRGLSGSGSAGFGLSLLSLRGLTRKVHLRGCTHAAGAGDPRLPPHPAPASERGIHAGRPLRGRPLALWARVSTAPCMQPPHGVSAQNPPKAAVGFQDNVVQGQHLPDLTLEVTRRRCPHGLGWAEWGVGRERPSRQLWEDAA